MQEKCRRLENFIKVNQVIQEAKLVGQNRATLAAEQLLQGELDNICRRLIEEALEGNMQAIKLVLDRILPRRKNRSIELSLPKLHNSDDVLKAISIIVNAVGCGEISPCEGEAASRIIDTYMKAIEVHDYEKRLSQLEEKKNL